MQARRGEPKPAAARDTCSARRLGCPIAKAAWRKHRPGYGRAPAPSKRPVHAICIRSCFGTAGGDLPGAFFRRRDLHVCPYATARSLDVAFAEDAPRWYRRACLCGRLALRLYAMTPPRAYCAIGGVP